MSIEKKLNEKVFNEFSSKNMMNTLQFFSKLHRLSGHPDAERAVDYIIDKLNESGVSSQRLYYRGLFSTPVKAKVCVISPESFEIPAIASSFSGDVKNLKASLYYEEYGEKRIHGSNGSQHRNIPAEQELIKNCQGKVVLTFDSSVMHGLIAKKAGALGKIHVWTSEEDLLHHTSISGAWGTPDAQTEPLLCRLPAVSIKRKDGDRLIDLCKRGDVQVEITIITDTAVRKSSMPIAEIPGKSGKYILVAGHYDSWYEGITDNAAGNAIMLELARIFQAHKSDLEHGVRIAWWSGHSDGHYAGSSWYCDHFWKDIHENCFAYCYLDICGGKNTDMIIPRGTYLEGPNLMQDIIEQLTGARPKDYMPITKSGDMSFWGPGIPLVFYALNEPLPEKKGGFSCLGGGPWWHTSDDTLDKIDEDILLRDARFNGCVVAELAQNKRIHMDLSFFMGKMRRYIFDSIDNLDAEFSPDGISEGFESLHEAAIQLETALKNCDDERSNEILIKIGSELVRLAFSTVDPFAFEPAHYPARVPPFAQFYMLGGLSGANCPEHALLFYKTGFQRDKNRLLEGFSTLERDIRNKISEIA